MKTKSRNPVGDSKTIAGRMILIAIGLAMLYWILESALHVFIFDEGNFIRQIFIIDPNEIWRRLLVGCILIMFGVYTQFTIIEHKRTGEALRESEDCYRDLVERAGIAILIDDEEGHFKYFNEKFAELFGYSFKETEEQSIKSLVHPEDIDRVMRYHRERLQGKKVPSRYEFRGVKKDSSTVYLEVDIVELKKGESIIGTRSYIWDITERKQAEEELRQYREHLEELVEERTNELRSINEQLEQDITERKRVEGALQISQERYKLATKAAKVGVWDWDIKTNGFYIDPNVKEVLGYKDEEIPNDIEIWTTYIHPDDLEPVMAAAQACIDGKTPEYAFEHRMMHKDGSVRWILTRGNVIRDAKRNVVRMVGTDTDITERKRAEEQLKRSEEDYRGLFESAHDAIIIFNPEGEIVLDVNQMACAIYGFDRSEFIGMSLKKISKDVPGGEKHIKVTLKKGFTHHFETAQYRKDGTEMLFEINASVIDYKGQRAILSINRDSTKRKRTEEEKAQHARDLEFLSRAAMGFVELPAKKDIYRFIGDQLMELIGDATYIVVNSFDKETRRIQVRAILGTSKNIKAALKTFDRDPTGMSFTINDEAWQGLTGGKLARVPGGLYELSFGGFPKVACYVLEKLAGTGDIYAMGFTKKGELYGSAAIVMRKGTELRNQAVIEAFVRQAGVALQRKRAEETLRESEQFNLSLMNNSPNPILVINPDTSVRYVNPALKKLTGFSSAEIIGKKAPYLWWTEETLKKTSKDLEKAMSKGAHKLEELFQTKNGERFWVEITSTPVKSNGKFRYYLANWVDITERKRTEEALRISQERYKLATKAAKVGVWDWDIKTNGFYIDPNVKEVLGHKDEEIPNDIEIWTTHIHPDDLEPVMAAAQACIDGKTPEYAFEHRMIHKDGSVRWILTRGNVIRDAKRNVVRMVGTDTDITERKQAEEALRESEARFRIASQIASDVVYERDGQTGIATFYGDIDSHLGYEPGGYPRTMEGWRKHVHLEDLAWINNKSIDQLEPGVPYTIEYRMRKKDGTYMTWSDRIMIIRDEKTGKPLKFIGAATDITERKRAQEEKDKLLYDLNERMKELNCLYEIAKIVEIPNIPSEEIFQKTVDVIPPAWQYPDITCASISIEGQEFKTPNYNATKWKQSADIEAHGKKVGMVEVCYLEERTEHGEGPFMKEERDLIEAIAERLGQIIERKRAEEALRASEQRYRLLFERNLAAVYRTTLDGTVLDCNESFARLLGYDSRDEVLARQASEFYFDVADREGFIGRLREQGSLTNFEFCMRRKDGSPVWILENVSLIKEEEGGSPLIQGTSIDITERRQAEEALRKAHDELEQRVQERTAELVEANEHLERGIEERKRTEKALQESELWMRNMFNSLEEAVFVVTPDRTLVNINQSAQKMFGYSKDELVDLSTEVLHVDQEHYIEFGRLIKEAFDKEKAASFEFEAKRKNGELFPTDHTVSLLKNDIGESLGIVSVVRDITERKRAEEELKQYREHLEELVEGRTAELRRINEQLEQEITERKQAEEALRESEERFRILFEQAADSVVLVDGQTQELVDFNDIAHKNLGFTREEFQNLKVQDIEVVESPEEVNGHAEKIRRKGEDTFETRLRAKNGELRDFIMKIRRLSLTGKDYLLGVWHDITERKKAEEALQEEKNKFQAIVDSMGYGLTIQDRDYNILYQNEALKNLVGDHLGEKCYRGYEFREKICNGCPARMAWADGESHTAERKVVMPSGEILFVENTASPIRDARGEIVACLEIIRNITERKRAEEALRESEERLRQFFENEPEYCYMISPEGTILDVNTAVLKALGYTKNELVGKHLKTIYAPEALPRMKQLFEKWEKTGKLWNEEMVIMTRNGNRRTVLLSANVVKDKDGNTVQSVSVQRDITERKRAEEALHHERNNLINILNAMEDGVYIVNQQYDIQYVNPVLKKDFGPVKGRKCYEYFHERKEVCPWCKNQDVFAGKTVRWEWYSFKNQKTYDLIDTPLRTPDGSISKLEIFRDITERKQAEEALQSEKDRLQALMEGLARTEIGIDVVGNDYKVLFQNQTLRERFGDLTGKLCYENYMGLKEPCDFCPMIEAIRDNKVESVELKAADGRNYELISAPFPNPDGTLDKVVEVVMDITERKKMEAQLIQAERLSAVGTLSYGIAHEFNNILAGILGNAEFGMRIDDPKEVNQCFRVIMESCDRAKGITNSLLAFSRQREIKKQRADVTEAVETVLGLTERELEKQKIELVRKFRPIPEITCNLSELSGVALNMITNARDAMQPKGGTLTVDVGKKRDNIEMIFTDTGCGIPDSIKSRIFEPFVTTKGALGKSEVPGTGLGLFLSYGIINRYHGEIKVKSEVGKGSKFTIKIPISKNQVLPALVESEEEKQAAVPQNLNILLVDDEKPICMAVKKFFDAKGHSVATALSGKKGLEIFKKGSFDLVLADITMPDMDGVELISKLKKIDQQVKFIVLTGNITEDKLESAKKAGANQILMKPFRNEELYQAVGRVLSI